MGNIGTNSLSPIEWTIFGVVVAVLIIFSIWYSRREKKNVAALAQRLGIQPEVGGSDDLLAGVWRGRHVRISEFLMRPGRHRQTMDEITNANSIDFSNKSKNLATQQWVEIAVAVRSHEFEFALRPENLGWKLKEFTGACADFKVGDVEFDRVWHVETTRSDVLLAMLTRELRTRINDDAANGARGEYCVEFNWLCYRERGGLGDAKRVARFESRLELLDELAVALETALGAAPST